MIRVQFTRLISWDVTLIMMQFPAYMVNTRIFNARWSHIKALRMEGSVQDETNICYFEDEEHVDIILCFLLLCARWVPEGEGSEMTHNYEVGFKCMCDVNYAES
jgi:hypothetical protein